MLSSVEQAFVGRDEKRAPLKTPAWEAITARERDEMSYTAFYRQGEHTTTNSFSLFGSCNHYQ